MIKIPIFYGDLLESHQDALMIPVNCVGTMGAGLALQAKQKWPQLDAIYRSICGQAILRPGKPAIARFYNDDQPDQIAILFPTKDDWRNPSRIDFIFDGLEALPALLAHEHGTHTISVPALGCGLGGLRWKDVQPILEEKLQPIIVNLQMEPWFYLGEELRPL